jgi:hypothetical protein
MALNNKIPNEVIEVVQKKITEEERSSKEKSDQFNKSLELAKEFQKAVKESEEQAERAIELAYNGNVPGAIPGNIPVEGAASLLQRDPKTQFKPLFMANCAGCHSYADNKVVPEETLAKMKPLFKIRDLEPKPDPKKPEKKVEPFTFIASDLAGFGTQEWIASFLKHPTDKRFFGRIKDPDGELVLEGMKKFVAREIKMAQQANGAKGIADLEADFDKIAGWLAKHPTGTDFKEPEDKAAFLLFKDKYDCTKCHQYEDVNKGAVSAPHLTGYGGQAWLHKMIRSPGHPDLYGEKNVQEFMVNGKPVKKTMMPSFFPASTTQAELQRHDYGLLLNKFFEIKKVEFADLSDIQREMLVRGLTGDYRIVFGGHPITAIEKKEKK